MEKKSIVSFEDIPKIVDELYFLMPQCKVFTFEGPLGAGKTTIIRMLLEKCEVKEPITSPTFNYVNIYKNSSKKRLYQETFYHFDLYRLHSLDGFIEAGFNELLYIENSWAFIEWPEIIMPILKIQVCKIKIDYASDFKDGDKRIITLFH